MNLKTLLSSSDQDQLSLKVPATQTVPQTPVKTFLAALLKTRPATSPCVIAGLKSDPDAQLCKSSQTNLRQSAAELLQAPAGYRMEAVTSHDGGCMRIRSSKIQLREFFFFLFLFVLVLFCTCRWVYRTSAGLSGRGGFRQGRSWACTALLEELPALSLQSLTAFLCTFLFVFSCGLWELRLSPLVVNCSPICLLTASL